MTTTRAIADITAKLLSEYSNGATVSTVAGSQIPVTGYAVGIKGLGAVIDGPDHDAISEWVTERLASSTAPGRYVGIWSDSATSRVYLDVVKVVSEKASAILLARKTGEIAVWDLGKDAEIRV